MMGILAQWENDRRLNGFDNKSPLILVRVCTPEVYMQLRSLNGLHALPTMIMEDRQRLRHKV